MHHSCNPALLLGHLSQIDGLSTSTSSANGRVFLISDKHCAQSKHSADVFRRIDHGVVLENRGYDSLTNGCPCGVRLRVEQWDVGRDGEEGQNRQVGSDRRE